MLLTVRNVRSLGHTEPPFAFYFESFFGNRRDGGGKTPIQLLLEGGAGEAGSRSKEAKSNAISDEFFAARKEFSISSWASCNGMLVSNVSGLLSSKDGSSASSLRMADSSAIRSSMIPNADIRWSLRN